MHFAGLLLPLAAFLVSVSGAPAAAVIEERAATTCGSTSYTADQVNQAAQKSCSYYKSGDAPGGYPHTYNNYEGFSFSVSGPYLEFPMLTSGVYTGGESCSLSPPPPPLSSWSILPREGPMPPAPA